MAHTTSTAAEERFIRDGVSANDMAGRLLGDVHIKAARLDAAIDQYVAAVLAHLTETAMGSDEVTEGAAQRRRLSGDVQQAHDAVEETLKDLERTYATIRRAFGES